MGYQLRTPQKSEWSLRFSAVGFLDPQVGIGVFGFRARARMSVRSNNTGAKRARDLKTRRRFRGLERQEFLSDPGLNSAVEFT
jgi:hypothetical protein